MNNDEKDYELLDSGENEKLERFGAVVLRRPDPQALWPKRLTADEWAARADGRFVRNAEEGKWVMKDSAENKSAVAAKSWPIEERYSPLTGAASAGMPSRDRPGQSCNEVGLSSPCGFFSG